MLCLRRTRPKKDDSDHGNVPAGVLYVVDPISRVAGLARLRPSVGDPGPSRGVAVGPFVVHTGVDPASRPRSSISCTFLRFDVKGRRNWLAGASSAKERKKTIVDDDKAFGFFRPRHDAVQSNFGSTWFNYGGRNSQEAHFVHAISLSSTAVLDTRGYLCRGEMGLEVRAFVQLAVSYFREPL